jgi:hypothetical protein
MAHCAKAFHGSEASSRPAAAERRGDCVGRGPQRGFGGGCGRGFGVGHPGHAARAASALASFFAFRFAVFDIATAACA